MGVAFCSPIIAVKAVTQRDCFELISNSYPAICCVSTEGKQGGGGATIGPIYSPIRPVFQLGMGCCHCIHD